MCFFFLHRLTNNLRGQRLFSSLNGKNSMWLKTKKTYIWIFWHIWKHLCLNRTVNTCICNVCSSLFPEVTSEYKVIGLSNCMLLSLRLTMHTSINTHTHKWHIQTHILSQLVSFSRRATGVITDCKLWFPVWRTSRCFCKLAQDEYLPKTHSTSKTFFSFFFFFFWQNVHSQDGFGSLTKNSADCFCENIGNYNCFSLYFFMFVFFKHPEAYSQG